MIARTRISGIVLLRGDDGAALLQHRDDKPGLPHAGLWVPPGGHCEPDESSLACAARELYEETNYRCTALQHLLDLDVDDVPHSPPLRLSVFWGVYDGRQTIICHEGQAVAFVTRAEAHHLAMPQYLLAVWDEALARYRAGFEVR
jgi:8-oxo-dGTP pyrophosphatase MutT (NUDIX family)